MVATGTVSAVDNSYGSLIYIDIAISLVELSARPSLAGGDISCLFLWLCLGLHAL